MISPRGVEAVLDHIIPDVDSSTAFILIGSAARGCATTRSDVDILIIGERLPSLQLRVPRFEFHRYDSNTFLERLREGDDFPNWCMRFGVILRGHHYWRSILDRAEGPIWPKWKRKVEVAARRWVATRLSLMTSDTPHAHESAIFAYDHLIRGLLLREGVFPLSRPELPLQIEPACSKLGTYLSMLINEAPHRIEWKPVMTVLSETIKDLDLELYKNSQERIRRLQSNIEMHNSTN